MLGATGTIGRATVRALLRRGHDVVCFVRPRAGVNGALAPDDSARRVRPTLAQIATRDLPAEARDTLALIDKGGPFPFDRDGIVFGNFEKRLPIKERG